jgi:hypothetical protein
MNSSCAAIAGMARNDMPARHSGAGGSSTPRTIIAYDRHGDLVEVDVHDLSTAQRKPARAAAPAQLSIIGGARGQNSTR